MRVLRPGYSARMTPPTPHPARSHLTILDGRSDAGRTETVGDEPMPAQVTPVQVTPVQVTPGQVGTVPVARGAGAGVRTGFRRRPGWFEANPGCFARAVLAACGAGVAGGGATAWAVWRAWRSSPVRRARAVVRLSRRAWRRYRRIRRWLGHRAVPR
jgi:hypothetical protein